MRIHMLTSSTVHLGAELQAQHVQPCQLLEQPRLQLPPLATIHRIINSWSNEGGEDVAQRPVPGLGSLDESAASACESGDVNDSTTFMQPGTNLVDGNDDDPLGTWLTAWTNEQSGMWVTGALLFQVSRSSGKLQFLGRVHYAPLEHFCSWPACDRC